MSKTTFLGLVKPTHGINEVEGETSGVPNEAANLDAIDAALLKLFNFDIPFHFVGAPGNAQVVGILPMTRALTIPAALAGTSAELGVAATASTVFTLKKNGTSFGTITFAIAGTVGTFVAATATAFAIGDVLTVVAQATADATAADLGLMIQAVRS